MNRVGKGTDSFTLIEVLIVAAIIIMLAGLLLPVFGRAREKARQTYCKANLKNLHLAVISYATDHDSYLPFAGSFELEDSHGKWHKFEGWITWIGYPPYPKGQGYHDDEEWEPEMVAEWWGDRARQSITNGTLWEYTGKNIKVYLCPTFGRDKVCGDKMPDGSVFDPVRSYAMNSYFHDRHNRRWWRRRLIKLTDSSKRLLFAEWHLDPTIPIDGDQPVCEIGSLEDKPDAYDGSFSGTNRTGQTIPVEAIAGYHSDRGNVVFLDGHIEMLSWSNTIESATATQ